MAVPTLSQTQDQAMLAKLLPIGEVVDRLSSTEPLDSLTITDETKIAFRLQPGWESELEAVAPTEPVNAFIKVAGVEHQLTAEGALQATSIIGLPQALVKKSPSNLVEQYLNYFWGSNLGSQEYSMLTVDGVGAAFTKSSLTPFSNLQLLQRALDVIERTHPGTTVLADYKFEHNLSGTNVRLILPDIDFNIEGTSEGDVPDGRNDTWHGGIHLRNSLVNKGQTAFEPYLFRWWCTNGCTTERVVGTDQVRSSWSRNRADGNDEQEVMAWAEQAVEEVLGGMEEEFARIQALTQLSVSGNVAEVLNEVFTQFQVPVTQRNTIRENILQSEGSLTMYSVLNAVTAAANTGGMDDARSDRLMRIGGAIPSAELDPLKARVWREGHAADTTAINPYEVHLLG